jgi:uncharacterized membrane protein
VRRRRSETPGEPPAAPRERGQLGLTLQTAQDVRTDVARAVRRGRTATRRACQSARCTRSAGGLPPLQLTSVSAEAVDGTRTRRLSRLTRMTTSRLEAFSDAVLAIIITIMVLELAVPHEPTLHALAESATGLLTYLLSFVYLGIYWNNHHHLFQLVSRVRGGVLWANLHLLFWLSLVPFTTAWMNEHFAPTPVMVYGVNLLLAGLAYLLLQLSVVRVDGPDSALRQALGRDFKGRISPVIYLLGIICSLLWVWLGIAAYVLVAVIWLVPDRRMEHYIDAHQEPPTLRP